jgi:hypothetical protein
MTSPKPTSNAQSTPDQEMTDPAPQSREDLAAMMLRVGTSGPELTPVQQEIVDRVIASGRLET